MPKMNGRPVESGTAKRCRLGREREQGLPRMGWIAVAILAAGLITGLGLPSPAAAQYNLFFGGRADADFTSEDWAIFKDAMRQVLEKGAIGSRADWKNVNTGFYGNMSVERDFEMEGLPCRHVAFNIMHADRQIPYRMNFCRTDQGNWVIAP